MIEMNGSFHAPPVTNAWFCSAVIKAGKHLWGLPAFSDFSRKAYIKSRHDLIRLYREEDSCASPPFVVKYNRKPPEKTARADCVATIWQQEIG